MGRGWKVKEGAARRSSGPFRCVLFHSVLLWDEIIVDVKLCMGARITKSHGEWTQVVVIGDMLEMGA